MSTTSLSRRNMESGHQPTDSQSSISMAVDADHLLALQQTVTLAEQRSTVSTYILCRVLIEIMTQTDLQSLTFETWYGGRFGTMKAYLGACRRSLQVLELPMAAPDPTIARMNFRRFGGYMIFTARGSSYVLTL